MQYDLLFGNCISGNVYISEQGLYYEISVTCCLPKEGIYKVVALTDKGRVSIGVLKPHNDRLTIEKRISKKVLGDNFLSFNAVSIAKDTTHTIPLNPEMQFLDLEKLDAARMVYIEGIPMIQI